MRQRIDRSSPVPIYHQIAEALRHRIAVGELHPGDRLPSVRDAAAELGVNLHTVRKAYGELATDALVRIAGPSGTEVLRGKVPRGRGDGLEDFLRRTEAGAMQQFGLSPAQLGQALIRRSGGRSGRKLPRAFFIECSELQCRGHCDELMAAWRVDARPWVLGNRDDLPDGVLLATFFHYNDIRQRWPARLDQVRFVAIGPEPSLPARVARGRAGRSTVIEVCELDEAKARNIAADLSILFPAPRFRIEPRVVLHPAEAIADIPLTRRVLLAPRVWAGLTPHQRTAPRVFQVEYRIQPAELSALGEQFGWRSALAEAALA
jgi:DNA-binding transcriptional regulator YhcF (GntR family)